MRIGTSAFHIEFTARDQRRRHRSSDPVSDWVLAVCRKDDINRWEELLDPKVWSAAARKTILDGADSCVLAWRGFGNTDREIAVPRDYSH